MAWITLQLLPLSQPIIELYKGHSEPLHLWSGRLASYEDLNNAFLGSVITFLPVPKAPKGLFSQEILNASRFSHEYKYVLRILPKMSPRKRGLINRRYNNGINYLNGSIPLLPINYLFMYGQNQNN